MSRLAWKPNTSQTFNSAVGTIEKATCMRPYPKQREEFNVTLSLSDSSTGDGVLLLFYRKKKHDLTSLDCVGYE